MFRPFILVIVRLHLKHIKELYKMIVGIPGGKRSRLTIGDMALNLWRGKGKAVPLQAWSGPEGSRKLGSQIS